MRDPMREAGGFLLTVIPHDEWRRVYFKMKDYPDFFSQNIRPPVAEQVISAATSTNNRLRFTIRQD